MAGSYGHAEENSSAERTVSQYFCARDVLPQDTAQRLLMCGLNLLQDQTGFHARHEKNFFLLFMFTVMLL
jgi:hypothetical protein